MLDSLSSGSARPLTVTEHDIERWKQIAGIEPDDVTRIGALKDVIVPRLDQHVGAFFDALAKFGAGQLLFAKHSAIEEARRRKREHLQAMLSGKYDRRYVEERIVLGLMYSEYGVEAREFMGAFQRLLRSMSEDIVKKFPGDVTVAFANYMSLAKIGTFDRSIICDVLIAERERTISLQRQAIRELSTPVLQVRDQILILPIIGLLDSDRASRLTRDLLAAIRATRCKIVVMDITGVAAVDSRVANHMIQTVAAARLMGSRVIITGLSADVAQALVALGIDLSGIDTKSDLQSGLERAERSLGYRVIRSGDAAPPPL
jgi:rsbT co-antagonist protein RsbR